MKSVILTMIVAFVMVNVIKSQYLPDYLLNEGEVWHKQKFSELNHYSKQPIIQKEYIPLEKRNYDVLRYDLFMDWSKLLDEETGTSISGFDGINKIQLVIQSDTANSIDFDNNYLFINSIKINNNPVPQFKSTFNKIIIPFDIPIIKGDTLLVEINYSFVSEAAAGIIYLEKGIPFELGPPPENDTIFTEERTVYTMSEPTDARKWMPCNDYPYDKALTSIAVRVPIGYSVTGNGKLIQIESDDITETFYWQHDFPITTYLMFAGATKFGYYNDWYKRVSNPNDSIKIEYYGWQKDIDDTTTNGRNYNAHYAFRNTVKMFELFSAIYGEYPFERYAMTTMPNTWFSGMEHQTNTTLNRNVIRVIDRWGRNRENSNQSVIAHELAHQWFGDYVTCSSWNDIWINEGGAVWSEALWDRRLGEKSYYDNIESEIGTFFWYNGRRQQPPIYAPGSSAEEIFNYATTYAKSGIFYHMLSETLGKEKFLMFIKDLFAHFAYQSIDTEQFKEFLKSKYPDGAPINIDEFFEQWIYKAGYPKFQIEITSEEITGTKDFSVDMNIKQIQEGADVPEVFRTPLWIKFTSSEGEIHQDSIYTRDREEIHNFTIPFMPVMYEVDTLKILCQVVNPPIISVKEQKTENTESLVFPNPITAGHDGNISFKNTINSKVKVEIYDELGQLLKYSYCGKLSAGSYEFELGVFGLSTGNYYVRISNGVKTIYNKFTIIK